MIMIWGSLRSKFAICAVCTILAIAIFRFSKADLWLRVCSAHTDLILAHTSLPTATSKPPASLPKPTPGVYYKTSAPIFEHTAYPIVEHFPRAAAAKTPADLPRVPSWNETPSKHVKEVTPLFIGFTRNWPLLQQAVIGYITAGWPPNEIYVVENTGTMLSNFKGLLNESNPFYLDHDRLKNLFGVNVIVTPTLYSFAQLQNMYLYEAITRNWTHYFWSHMDVLPQSWEDREPYKSLYTLAVEVVRESFAPSYARDGLGRDNRWALRYLSYDWLTLMNTASMIELGGWDTMVSYYGTDCDMYERMRMAGLATDIADAGKIWDVGESLPDLGILYRVNDELNSTAWHKLQETLHAMQKEKVHGKLSRNSWQMQQHGGKGQPFYRDMAGFEEALEITIKAGEAVYKKKWGTGRCDLRNAGLHLEDQWNVEKVVG